MIICFSGNGNTWAASRELAAHLGEEIIRLHGTLLRDPAARQLTIPPDARVIWTFPVHSWGVPPVVLRFIREATIDGADDARHFMVATMGDDAGLTADMWRREIKSRGWDAAAAFGVIMPNTYVSFPGFTIDSPELTAAKLAAMPPRMAAIADAILSGSRTDNIHRGSFPALKSRVIYPQFVRHAMSAKRFRVNPALCTGCGTCARSCPMDNITMLQQPGDPRPIPRWGEACATCMACFHRCPHGAISRGWISQGKARYPGPPDLPNLP